MKTHLQRRSGFTLVEMTIACWLTAMLAILLSTTWALLMRPTADLIAWGQLFQEMDIAVATLTRDLGGNLPDNAYQGAKTQGLLLACQKTNDPSTGDHLQLCFDGSLEGHVPDGTPTWDMSTGDTIIDYHVDADSHTLVRTNQNAGTSFTVARCVDSITLNDSDPDTIQITITFAYYFPHSGANTDSWKKHLTRTCVLIAKKKP